MKKLFPGIIFLLLAALFVAAGIREGGSILIGGAALGALFLFLAVRSFVRKAKNAPAVRRDAPAPAAPAKPAQPARQEYQFVNFKVAGVTFKNEDGSDRQTILRHIKFQDPPYITDPDNVDIEIKHFEYQGEPAFRCVVNGYTIGNVPKAQVQEVADAIEHGAVVSGFHVTGGGSMDGEKIRYGCDIALRYPASDRPLQ